MPIIPSSDMTMHWADFAADSIAHNAQKVILNYTARKSWKHMLGLLTGSAWKHMLGLLTGSAVRGGVT
jgi:hypothetical protein